MSCIGAYHVAGALRGLVRRSQAQNRHQRFVEAAVPTSVLIGLTASGGHSLVGRRSLAETLMSLAFTGQRTVYTVLGAGSVSA